MSFLRSQPRPNGSAGADPSRRTARSTPRAGAKPRRGSPRTFVARAARSAVEAARPVRAWSPVVEDPSARPGAPRVARLVGLVRDALRGLQQRLTEAFPRIAARFGADRLRSEREPKTAVVTGASTRAPVAKAAAPAPAATSSTAAASAPDTTIAAARGESLAAELDRDDPELVAKLQAVDTKSRAYGTALRVLARLGTLESNAPPDRKARAEAEIGPLLRLVDRIRELELRVPAERIVVLDHDMEVLPE